MHILGHITMIYYTIQSYMYAVYNFKVAVAVWLFPLYGHFGKNTWCTPILYHLVFTTGPIPVVNLLIDLVCLSIWAHISVTAGRNFVLLGMMMGYDLGMMPIIKMFWYSLVSQIHRRKCLFKKKDSRVIKHTAATIHSPFYPWWHIINVWWLTANRSYNGWPELVSWNVFMYWSLLWEVSCCIYQWNLNYFHLVLSVDQFFWWQ